MSEADDLFKQLEEEIEQDLYSAKIITEDELVSKYPIMISADSNLVISHVFMDKQEHEGSFAAVSVVAFGRGAASINLTQAQLKHLRSVIDGMIEPNSIAGTRLTEGQYSGKHYNEYLGEPEAE